MWCEAGFPWSDPFSTDPCLRRSCTGWVVEYLKCQTCAGTPNGSGNMWEFVGRDARNPLHLSLFSGACLFSYGFTCSSLLQICCMQWYCLDLRDVQSKLYYTLWPTQWMPLTFHTLKWDIQFSSRAFCRMLFAPLEPCQVHRRNQVSSYGRFLAPTSCLGLLLALTNWGGEGEDRC